jgi:hypothetical protein
VLVDEVIDYLYGLGAGLALNHAVLDGDGEIVRTAPHMDVRRIMIEGVDVNQYALYDEYRTHIASSFYCLSATKVQNLFDKYVTLPFFILQVNFGS